MANEATNEGWERAHTELLRLSHERARLDIDEGHWLLSALRTGAHLRLGYASFAEYVERLFGYSPRWTAEKLRVAEALETLPELSRALADGGLSWSVVRELTRAATAETEADWLAYSRGRTVRDVERMISGHAPGSRPDDPSDPAAKRHALRFEVSGVVLATFREALAKLRRDADAPLDDDAALLLMARQILGGPSDAGVSSYQVAVTVCEQCRRGTVQGRGEPVSVERDIVAMANCDGQSFTVAAGTDTHVGHTESRAKQSIPPAVRRLVHHRARWPLPSPRLPSRRLRGRPPHRSQSRRRLARLRKSRDPLFCPPSCPPPRRARDRGSRVGGACVPARRRLRVRLSFRIASRRRRPLHCVPSAAIPWLSRGRSSARTCSHRDPRGQRNIGRSRLTTSARHPHQTAQSHRSRPKSRLSSEAPVV
jgi:hypothetical protein